MCVSFARLVGLTLRFKTTFQSTTEITWLCEVHGENDLVVSRKRFVNIAPANRNCWGDNFIGAVTTVIVVLTIHIVVVTIENITTTILDC